MAISKMVNEHCGTGMDGKVFLPSAVPANLSLLITSVGSSDEIKQSMLGRTQWGNFHSPSNGYKVRMLDFLLCKNQILILILLSPNKIYTPLTKFSYLFNSSSYSKGFCMEPELDILLIISVRIMQISSGNCSSIPDANIILYQGQRER